MTVLIAGGGISGLALGLTCHQIGVPFKVFESVSELRPLGVGINLQPTAVRELFDLGIDDALDTIGIRTRDYGMYSKKGLQVWSEPRGTWAGYKWPQYSVHRGKLHMLLYETLLARAGENCVETGWSATGFTNQGDEAVLELKNAEGHKRQETGRIIIGADGIHSTLRATMEPDEGPPLWGGHILWRATTRAKPFLSGASMVMVGHAGLRFVSYPITQADAETGEADINWIAMLQKNPDDPWRKEDWAREAKLEEFAPKFDELKFDWIDIPALIAGAEKVYEYPMVDRNPIDRWTHGRVSLMGDAAHAAYPVGSNGAGSGILDARKLGAAFIKYGLTETALLAYENEMRPVTSKVVLMNRVAGPDAILDVVEARCGGQFDDINDVISQTELAEHAEKYKLTAGYGIAETNASAPTIADGGVYNPSGR